MTDPLYDDEIQLSGGPRPAAAAGHQVVAVDQRGHGRSEQVADGYTTGRTRAPPSSTLSAYARPSGSATA